MAPVKAYFKNKGEKVMRSMKREYGSEKGEEVFYATANKRKMKPRQTARTDTMRKGSR
jgi:hypothetical protein